MEWISVKDRLPNNNELVIAYGKKETDSEKDVWLVTFYKEVIEKCGDHKKNISDQYWEKTNGYDVDEVTHWMPLPQPPKDNS